MNSNRPQAEANTLKNDIRMKADTNSTQSILWKKRTQGTS